MRLALFRTVPFESWDYINVTDEKYKRYRDFIYGLRYDSFCDLDYINSYERHYRNLYLAAESAQWIVMDLPGIK